jgi:hypothetical protein
MRFVRLRPIHTVLLTLTFTTACGQGPITPTPPVQAPEPSQPTTTAAFPPGHVYAAVAVSPSPVHGGRTVHISFRLYGGDSPSDDPLDVLVDFGDGTIIDLGAVTSADVEHVYAGAGVFTISFTVKLPSGSLVASTTAPVP